MRKRALLYALHPCAKYAHRHLMFLFAGHSTGMAADTAVLINHKSVSHVRAAIALYLLFRCWRLTFVFPGTPLSDLPAATHEQGKFWEVNIMGLAAEREKTIAE
jgi:hypothetical protein